MTEPARNRGTFFDVVRHRIDWLLFVSVVLMLGAGLVTMFSFFGESTFFSRQIIWIAVGFVLFGITSFVDWRFLRRTGVVVTLFILGALSLLFLFLLGTPTLGAISRFDLGIFFVQPSDPVKIILILVLAKYFSRRHVEIAHYKHIIVSGLYAFVLFVLLFLQPDFGGAIIVFLIWLGMILVSGVSKKHIALIGLAGVLIFSVLWGFVFADYQKDRIVTLIHPLTDIHGAGYNANQSTIAVGSGQVIGKGVGFGTQSRLEFLPEYETDFIFAAFSEEWGFVGVLVLFALFGVIIWRIILYARHGETNFETFFAFGVAIMFMSQFIVHVGMNIGLLPITGTVMPFMSYGGSHLAIEFIALGMLMGMRVHRHMVGKEKLRGELVGPQ